MPSPTVRTCGKMTALALVLLALGLDGCQWAAPYEASEPNRGGQQAADGGAATDASIAETAGAKRDRGPAVDGADARVADGPVADAAPADISPADDAVLEDFTFPDFAIFLDGSIGCGDDLECGPKYRCCSCKCVLRSPRLVCPMIACPAIE